MSRDVIERGIKRGAGGLEGQDVEEIRYEGYGPAGVAVIVECMTNNRNRAVAEVRHAFSKHGGNLGTDGSVAYLFKKLGQLTFSPDIGEEQVLEVALDLDVEDVIVHEDKSIDVITAPEIFSVAKKVFDQKKLQPAQSEIAMIASVRLSIADKEIAEKLCALTDALEDLEDVQAVYTNADIEVMDTD